MIGPSVGDDKGDGVTGLDVGKGVIGLSVGFGRKRKKRYDG